MNRSNNLWKGRGVVGLDGGGGVECLLRVILRLGFTGVATYPSFSTPHPPPHHAQHPLIGDCRYCD